ncbi:peptidoglycan-binding domain-containing protein [Embleya sp. AB8]|uniref:peptidoglycan-binding domain-containing protein n=1 Tax=Embleya sp. AB8 TaxID=3156304 RepID=UPI003C721F1E
MFTHRRGAPESVHRGERGSLAQGQGLPRRPQVGRRQGPSRQARLLLSPGPFASRPPRGRLPSTTHRALTRLRRSPPRSRPVDCGLTAGRPATANRMWVLLCTTIAAVLLAGGGPAAARFVKSPNEKAAEAEEPAPSMITTMWRDAYSPTPWPCAARSPPAKPWPSPPAPRPRTARTLAAQTGGDRHSGQDRRRPQGRPDPHRGLRPPGVRTPRRPPVYRDLKPGRGGRDVEQLQTALTGLSHKTGAHKTGAFGTDTRAAVASFYRALGYDAPTAGEDDSQTLKAAQDRITTTEHALAQPQDALRAGPPGASAPPPTGPAGAAAGASPSVTAP